MGDVGFADPAQTEAGEGDAELGGREGGVEVLGGLKGEFYAPAAGLLERAELADADLHEGEFGGDKKAVGSDEGEDNELWMFRTGARSADARTTADAVGRRPYWGEKGSRASAARETRPMASAWA